MNFKEAIEKIAVMNDIHAEDYPDCVILDNGEIICPECGEKKVKKIHVFEQDRLVKCMCKCDIKRNDEEIARQAAEERKIKHDHIVAKIKRSGFADDDTRKMTFENDDLSNPRITNAMKAYVANWDKFRADGLGLLLWGQVETGKTFASCCVANAIAEKEISVIVTTFGRIENTLFGMDKGKQTYIDALCNVGLLVIDDLGVERKSDFMKEIVYTIIDGRYRSGRPMIISTNLTLSEIKSPVDISSQRIYSRILERCHPVHVDGIPRRREKIKARYEETQKLLGL